MRAKKKKKSSFGVSFRVIYNFLFLLDCKDVIMGYDSVEVNTRIIALKALLVRFFFCTFGYESYGRVLVLVRVILIM